MSDEILMYGAAWCGDCRRAKAVLDRRGVRYRYLDVEHDERAREEAVRVGRSRRIPVIVFPDGSVLVEPSDPELEERLDRSG